MSWSRAGGGVGAPGRPRGSGPSPWTLGLARPEGLGPGPSPWDMGPGPGPLREALAQAAGPTDVWGSVVQCGGCCLTPCHQVAYAAKATRPRDHAREVSLGSAGAPPHAGAGNGARLCRAASAGVRCPVWGAGAPAGPCRCGLGCPPGPSRQERGQQKAHTPSDEHIKEYKKEKRKRLPFQKNTSENLTRQKRTLGKSNFYKKYFEKSNFYKKYFEKSKAKSNLKTDCPPL